MKFKPPADDLPTQNVQWQKRNRQYGAPWGRWINCTEANGRMLAGLHSWETRVIGEPRTDPVAVLAELVALKRMHDAIEAAEARGTDNFVGGKPLPFAKDDYRRRKQVAWDAAFTLVDHGKAGGQ